MYTIFINNGISAHSKYTTVMTLATLNAGNESIKKFFIVEMYRLVSDSTAYTIFCFSLNLGLQLWQSVFY